MSTNGRQPFVALRPCGHVLRERVVSEAVSEASGRGGEQGEGGGSIKKSCPVCNAAVSATVRMLPPAEAAEALRVELRRAREQQRKAPKRKLTPQGATGLDPRNVGGALSSQPHLPRPAPPPSRAPSRAPSRTSRQNQSECQSKESFMKAVKVRLRLMRTHSELVKMSRPHCNSEY